MRITAELVRSVNPPFKAWSDLADTELPVPARYHFYLAAVTHASGLIDQLAAGGKRVLCDRYVATTQVRYGALGVKLIPDHLLAVRQPEATILITCDEIERVRRVSTRGPTTNDELELDDTYVAEALRRYREYIDASFDTTTAQPAEVVDAIAKWLSVRD